jgi:membrane-associated phospholipid phosphatase
MIPERRKKIIAIVIIIISIGFLALSAFIAHFPTTLLDEHFSEKIQSFQNPTLNTVMEMISWFGYFPGSIVMVALAALVFLIGKYKREALFMLLTGLAGLVSTIFKVMVNRPRPSEPLVHVFKKASQQSFPSGHVLFYVVYFGMLTLLMIQLKEIPKIIRISVSAISLFLIFTIPFSRIYLGAHWFTDVVGGALLGLVCLYTLSYFYERKATKVYENEV